MRDSVDEHLQQGCLNDTAGKGQRSSDIAETFSFWVLCDQHLYSGWTYWGRGFHSYIGLVWLPNHLHQGQRCPQMAVVYFTGGISQFRKQEVLDFCEHWGHLGPCFILLALSSGCLLLCICSSQRLVPSKSHTGFWGGNQPLASLQENQTPVSLCTTVRKIISSSNRIWIHKQLLCLRYLLYFFGVCFFLKRKCMVNYTYR